jgi:PAS domain S-box-containing protein
MPEVNGRPGAPPCDVDAHLELVTKSMRALTACASLSEFYVQLLEALAFHTGAGHACVHVQEGHRLRQVAHWPPQPGRVLASLPGMADALAMQVLATHTTEQSAEEAGGSALCVPLRGAQPDPIMGVITLYKAAYPSFTPRDTAIADLLATFAFERLCTLHVNRALAERERQYHLLEENIRDVLWICDSGGRLSYVSPAATRLTGVRPEAFEGKHVLDTLEPVWRPALLRTVVRLQRSHAATPVAERAQQTVEMQYTRPDGTLVWLESRIGPLCDDSGAPCGFVGVSRDISTRKRLELEDRRRTQQLMQADKLVSLGTLVGGIAHEINNPNHLILTSASLIEAAWSSVQPLLDVHREAYGEGPGPADDLFVELQDVPQLLRHLVTGSERIQRVVTDLRDFARGDTAKLDQAVDLNAVVEQSVRIMGSGIHKHALEFRKTLGTDLPMIRGNFIRLEQLLIHLLQNASQALHTKRGHIGVTTYHEAADDLAVLEVWDTGPGISEEHLLQVFDPFFTTKRDLGCIGLGLPVCTAIVRQHHGQITVENRSEGGVRARVSFPRATP